MSEIETNVVGSDQAIDPALAPEDALIEEPGASTGAETVSTQPDGQSADQVTQPVVPDPQLQEIPGSDNGSLPAEPVNSQPGDINYLPDSAPVGVPGSPPVDISKNGAAFLGHDVSRDTGIQIDNESGELAICVPFQQGHVSVVSTGKKTVITIPAR